MYKIPLYCVDGPVTSACHSNGDNDDDDNLENVLEICWFVSVNIYNSRRSFTGYTKCIYVVKEIYTIKARAKMMSSTADVQPPSCTVVDWLLLGKAADEE